MLGSSTFPSAICLCLAVAAKGSIAQEQGMSPGYWQFATTLSVEGRGIVVQENEKICINVETANMSLGELVGHLTDGLCRATNATSAAGSEVARMSCENPEEKLFLEGEVRATYTATTYDYDADLTLIGPGGTSSGQYVGIGHRVGDCK